MVQVQWIKSKANSWLAFETFNIASAGDDAGVYVIWYNGNPGRVVRLGQGNVQDRLTKHRGDKQITAYSTRGLLVTWATVPKAQRDGVERWLADHYPPLVGDAFPDVQPIAVNAPW